MIVSEQKVKQHRFMSIMISLIGWLIFVGSITAISMLTLFFFASMQWVIAPIIALFIVMILGLGLIIWGMMIRGRLKKFNTFRNIINNRKQVSLEELSAKGNQSVNAVIRELETMLSINYFPGAYIDHQNKRLILDPSAEEEELEEERPTDEPCDVIEGASEFLQQLRAADQKIRSSIVSVHIWNIEGLAKKIFSAINNNPEKATQIRKFLSYYLPTTIKLLNAYQVLEKQGIEQVNIVQTKARIEKALETIGLAFEKQLDQLFSKEALDITTDIQVLESLLQQDGIGPEDWPQS